MECRQCGNPVSPEATFCEACGARVDRAAQPVTPGRKWAARLLRFLGMTVIVAAALITGISWEFWHRTDRPAIAGMAVAAVVMGGGINYAGRRLNPQAGKVTAWGVFGGLLGGAGAFLVAVIVAGLIFFGAVAAAVAGLFG